jgi:hypothetical protein
VPTEQMQTIEAKRDGIFVSNIMLSFALVLNLKGMFAWGGQDEF